ncbi:MAG TPA: TetR/AcrR family transcriptional regulator [Solirubrobacterales bacterium]|nr:TetR/AcrR family transcriptional regulator [Solirubrobacterales bacterium]
MSAPRGTETAAERGRILASVTHLVGENGYAATSLSEVLDRAGVGEEEFRRHFEDLRSAFLVAWQAASDRYMEAALVAFQGETGWRSQIRAVARSIFEFVLRDPHQGRILFAEGCDPEQPVRKQIDDPNAVAFVALIDAGRQQMPDPEMLTKATAEGIFGAVKEQVARALEEKDLARLPALYPQLMSMVVRPYLGDQAAREELLLGPPHA